MNDLSSILDETPRFSFFNELVSIPIAPVLQHDLFKINKLLDDITCYLFQVLRLFEKFKVKRNQFKGNELDWYYEGKDELLDIIRNINSIDGIIGKLLEALDESPHLTPSHALLEKFEQASDLLLDVKKYSILSKKKLNVAINFKDLESVILSLTREIEQCERVIVRLFLEQKLNKNNQVEMADYSLETILSKINASNGEKSSLLLPTFSSLEDEMYETWLLLQTKVVPLKASLDFLPMRIAEFEMIRNNNNVTIATSSQFAGSKSEVDVIYQDLQLKWHSLGDQLDAIKFETITKKWKQVFTFMIDEVSKICSQLILQVKSESSTTSKLFIASYKLCSNSIDVINKAFLEKIISEVSLILAFNEKLLPKWYLLHDTLTKQHVLDQSFHSTPRNTGNRKSVEVSGLRPFSIILKRPLPSPEPEQPLENGYGIDLGIGIQQVEIPFSIKQNGKVRDFFKQSSLNMAPIKSPQRLLQSLNSDDEVETDDDTSTLVTSKRYISIEEKDIYNGLMRLSIQEKWEYLRNNNKRNFGLASRIPIILFNYRQLGYQVIKKKILVNSKIPMISPNHPVFHNSIRKSRSVSNEGERLQLKPPVVLLRQPNGTKQPPFSPTPSRERSSSSSTNEYEVDTNSGDSVFRKPTRKPSIIDSSKHILRLARSMSSIPKTPPLAFQQSPTWRSTSPERPSSAIGSRYDNEHLIQPLESPKPSWK